MLCVLSAHDLLLDAESRLSAKLQASRGFYFDIGHSFPVSLIFAAGPNAAGYGSPTGSMARTLNRIASGRNEGAYQFFRESVKETLRVSLDAMVAIGAGP